MSNQFDNDKNMSRSSHMLQVINSKVPMITEHPKNKQKGIHIITHPPF